MIDSRHILELIMHAPDEGGGALPTSDPPDREIRDSITGEVSDILSRAYFEAELTHKLNWPEKTIEIFLERKPSKQLVDQCLRLKLTKHQIAFMLMQNFDEDQIQEALNKIEEQGISDHQERMAILRDELTVLHSSGVPPADARRLFLHNSEAYIVGLAHELTQWGWNVEDLHMLKYVHGEDLIQFQNYVRELIRLRVSGEVLKAITDELDIPLPSWSRAFVNFVLARFEVILSEEERILVVRSLSKTYRTQIS